MRRAILLGLLVACGDVREPQPSPVTVTISCHDGPSDADIWVRQARLEGSGGFDVALTAGCLAAGGELLVEVTAEP